MPSEFHNREPPPSPSEILKAIRGIVWIFSGIAQYNTVLQKLALTLFEEKKNLQTHEKGQKYPA